MEHEVIEIIEQEQEHDNKTVFQCLCCKNEIENDSPQVEFDSIQELRAHLAVNHLQEYFLKHIRTGPICPYKNCNFHAENYPTILAHYRKDHRPDAVKLPNTGNSG